jgi:hypothetical protein
MSDGRTERAMQDVFKRAKDGLLAKQLICLWGGMCGQWRNRSHGAVAAGGQQWPLATGVTSGNARSSRPGFLALPFRQAKIIGEDEDKRIYSPAITRW